MQSGVPGATLIGVDFGAAVAVGRGAAVGREVAIGMDVAVGREVALGMDVAAGSGVAPGKGVEASVAKLAQAVATSRITIKMIMRNCLSKIKILLIKLTPLVKLYYHHRHLSRHLRHGHGLEPGHRLHHLNQCWL